MAKRVERFSWPIGGDRLGAGTEVFVRAYLTGSTVWDGETRSHDIALNAPYAGDEPRRVSVPSRDIVAMVVDDSRYAFEPYDHARGQGLKFPSPEHAAQHLAALGWTVTPPPVRHRSHLEVTAGGKTASLTITSESSSLDAHVEPIGEPRFFVRPVPRFAGRDEFEVLDRERPPHDGPTRWRAAGPFLSRHLAQAEADDLNNGVAQ